MKEEELVKINYSDKIQKVSLFIIGTFLSALAFNLFLAPYNIVTGGISGVSLVVSKFYKRIFNPIMDVLIHNEIINFFYYYIIFSLLFSR